MSRNLFVAILCVAISFFSKISYAEINSISELLSKGYQVKAAIVGGALSLDKLFLQNGSSLYVCQMRASTSNGVLKCFPVVDAPLDDNTIEKQAK